MKVKRWLGNVLRQLSSRVDGPTSEVHEEQSEAAMTLEAQLDDLRQRDRLHKLIDKADDNSVVLVITLDGEGVLRYNSSGTRSTFSLLLWMCEILKVDLLA